MPGSKLSSFVSSLSYCFVIGNPYCSCGRPKGLVEVNGYGDRETGREHDKDGNVCPLWYDPGLPPISKDSSV